MTRAPLLVAALLAVGCSLVLAPDRDYTRDGGTDGGMDGGRDAGPDAGDVDGGDTDGGCPGSQGIETSCSDMIDNDCNGLTDCADFACRASPACCDSSSAAAWPPLAAGGYDLFWREDGEMDLVTDENTIDFGTAIYPQAVVFDQCAPVSFGLDFTVSFDVNLGAERGDYAAFLLSPVNMRTGTEPFLSELALRVLDSGEVRLERAGALVHSEMLNAGTVNVSIEARPGLDAASRGVVLVTANVNGSAFGAAELPFLPLSDLRGPAQMCEPDGLFLVMEGQGRNVTVLSKVTATTAECENPNQFLRDNEFPALDLVSRLEPSASANGDWRAGGVGEPSVAHFRNATTERLELWVDAAAVERSDELLRFIDFTVGASRLQGTWMPRLLGGDPRLAGPSAREPSISAPLDAADVMVGDFMLFAYAKKRGALEIYDLVVREVDLFSPPNFRIAEDPPTLAPIDAGDCESLRDPSVVALGEDPQTDGALLFYTCEQEGRPDRIGVARVAFNAASMRYEVTVNDSARLTDAVGDYAARGAFSPEAVLTRDGAAGVPRLRLWFLTRDRAGQVAMSAAVGEIPMGEALPVLSAYPGNPTLLPTDPILGGDCSIGCTIDAVGVSRTLSGGRWADPSFLIVVAHSRQTVSGVDHELVPILQPRGEME